MEEYDQLRGRIKARTIRFGLGMTAYIALTGTAQVREAEDTVPLQNICIGSMAPKGSICIACRASCDLLWQVGTLAL